MLAIKEPIQPVNVLRRLEPMTPREIVQSFLDSQSRANTRRAYQESLRAFSVWAGASDQDYLTAGEQFLISGRCSPSERVEDAAARINSVASSFVSNMTASGLAARTIRVRATALTGLVKHAVFYGYLATHLNFIDLPEIEIDGDGIERAASREDITKIKQIANNQIGFARLRDVAILHLLHPIGARIGGIDAGGRRTGILGLNVEDVRDSDVMITSKGKSQSSRIPLPSQEIIDAIMAYKSARGGNPDDPFFVGIDKYGNVRQERLDPAVFRRRLKSWGKSVGAGRVNPHAHRHRVGTDLARQVDSLAARDQLGHADTKTTDRYYVGTDRDRLVDVVANL